MVERNMLITPKYFLECFFVRRKEEESKSKLYYHVVLPDITFKRQ